MSTMLRVSLFSFGAILANGVSSPVAAQVNTSAAQVSVVGSGNVGIGQMSGGTVQLGLTREEATALAKATAMEQTRILEGILRRWNSELAARFKDRGISLGAASTFLTAVKGKEIPEANWPQVFGTLIADYLALGSRIGTTPVTSEKIDRLVREADQARRNGNFPEADQRLQQAEVQAVADAKAKRRQATELTRQVASLISSRANLARLSLDFVGAAQQFERAFDERVSDLSEDSHRWLMDASGAWSDAGSFAEAERVSTRAIAVATEEANKRIDSRWRQISAACYVMLGDVRQRRGNLHGAKDAFEEGMRIWSGLAKSMGVKQHSAGLRRMALKLIDVQTQQGDVSGALREYRAYLEAQKRAFSEQREDVDAAVQLADAYWLVASAEVQQELLLNARANLRAGLSVIEPFGADSKLVNIRHLLHRNLGLVHQYLGEWELAKQSFLTAVEIGDTVASSSPSTHAVKASVLASLGEAQARTGDVKSGIATLEKAVAATRQLQSQRNEDPSLQIDLAGQLAALGDLQVLSGQISVGILSHREALDLQALVSARDQSNTNWQRRLALRYADLGRAHLANREYAKASSALSSALAIANRLAGIDIGNFLWRRDPIVFRVLLGNVLKEQGNLAGALDEYSAALELRRKAVNDFPTHRQAVRELVGDFGRVGDVQIELKQVKQGRASYSEATALAMEQAKTKPSHQYDHERLVVYMAKLAELGDDNVSWSDVRSALATMAAETGSLSPAAQRIHEVARTKTAP
jgi:tetratricopeptide (TPR) repeat protein